MHRSGLKKAIIFVLCAILAVAGWIVWDTCLRPGGEDEFDEAFLREFDPAYIIDHMDELRKTGLFEYQIANETIANPKRLIIWPAGSDSLRSPVYISIQENAEDYFRSYTAHKVTWDRVRTAAKYYAKIPEELKSYKYMYTICFMVPKGQIWYNQLGNSRKECMETAQENLLWIMSLLD